MPATVSRISSRREVYVHLDLDEPADVDMLPMPMRTEQDEHGQWINPDPVVRALVILRTLDGVPEQPILTLSTGRGRHVTAGVGQNPDERDDTLLQRFANLIDAARERVAYLDLPPAPADPPRMTRTALHEEHLATVRHLGATTTPALHVCHHGGFGTLAHVCSCNLGTDHPRDQHGAYCTFDETTQERDDDLAITAARYDAELSREVDEP